MMTRDGKRTISRYGVNALNPIVLNKITRIGVKQHIVTSTVPQSAVYMPFFEA
jgi:hypothetical protein